MLFRSTYTSHTSQYSLDEDLYASVWFENNPIMIILRYSYYQQRYVTDPIRYFNLIKHLNSIKIHSELELDVNSDFVSPHETINNLLCLGKKPVYSWWERFINYKKIKK